MAIPDSVSCSVCLDIVADSGQRSIAKLKCGHSFHLDCIGSTFNSKGAMQCPNCRQVEQGQWLFANGCLHEDVTEDLALQAHYEMYGGIPNIVHHQDETFVQMPWCPYQGSHPQFAVPLEEINHPTSRYSVADSSMMVNARHNTRSGYRGHNCPYLAVEIHSSGAAPPMHYAENLALSMESLVHERNQWPHHTSITLASTSSSNRFDQQTGRLFHNPLFIHPGAQGRSNGGASMSSGQAQNHGVGVSFQPLLGSNNANFGRGPRSWPSTSSHHNTERVMESSPREDCWESDHTAGPSNQMPTYHSNHHNMNLHGENEVESWIQGQAYAPRGPFWWTWVPPSGGSSQSVLANMVSTGYLEEHSLTNFNSAQNFSRH